jgi:prepilin-type N-terminal cleavage/methylation domain-containing protein
MKPCCRRRPHSAFRIQYSAFTLIELLVVISIIAILLTILVPVIGNIRKRAQAVNTQAGIAQLEALISAYQGDFKAYPGPIPNTQLRGAAPNNITFKTPGLVGSGPQITMAENLFLGLQGGLVVTRPIIDPLNPQIQYDANLAGKGPQALGPIPKQYPPYGESTDYSLVDGHYTDEVVPAGIDDSSIPEYLDRFPNRMPILYLRARAGVVTTAGQVVVTPLPSTAAQYDQTQVTPYTAQTGGSWIGVGKENDGELRAGLTSRDAAYYAHGFNTAPNVAANLASEYPYNINAALKNAAFADTPKMKDKYILISAGVDRIYGTKDDITNFGGY